MQQRAIVPLALAALPSLSHALGVTGTAIGFASGTTGGAAGSTVTPTTTDELTEYLTSDEALTIVLTTTFDYTGTEGTTTETGCAPWGTASACQLAINAIDWCGDNPAVEVTYDNAGTTPIDVASNKSIVGSGSDGVIKGKGLRFTNGVSNIILQNVHITDLNPEYVWGGDAINLDGSSNIWIDHVKTSLIGRQHIVSGYETNTAITVSYTEFDGVTSWSPSCSTDQYWNLFFIGENDQITLKSNYIHNTSGRAPKVGGNATYHMVNNYWADNSGHAFEGDESYTLLEGNTFDNVSIVADTSSFTAIIYAATGDGSCSSYIGRDCVANTFIDSGEIVSADASTVLALFEGLELVEADADASDVPTTAGIGTLSQS